MAELAGALKSRPEEAVERVKSLMDDRKALQAEVAQLRREMAMGGGGRAPSGRARLAVSRCWRRFWTGYRARICHRLIDAQKSRLGSGIVMLIAETGGKAAVAAGVTQDLTDRVSAVELVRARWPNWAARVAAAGPTWPRAVRLRPKMHRRRLRRRKTDGGEMPALWIAHVTVTDGGLFTLCRSWPGRRSPSTAAIFHGPRRAVRSVGGERAAAKRGGQLSPRRGGRGLLPQR